MGIIRMLWILHSHFHCWVIFSKIWRQNKHDEHRIHGSQSTWISRPIGSLITQATGEWRLVQRWFTGNDLVFLIIFLAYRAPWISKIWRQSKKCLYWLIQEYKNTRIQKWPIHKIWIRKRSKIRFRNKN